MGGPLSYEITDRNLTLTGSLLLAMTAMNAGLLLDIVIQYKEHDTSAIVGASIGLFYNCLLWLCSN